MSNIAWYPNDSSRGGVPDPVAVSRTDKDIQKAFLQTYLCLEFRISRFVNIPIRFLDQHELKRRLIAIGRRDSQI